MTTSPLFKLLSSLAIVGLYALVLVAISDSMIPPVLAGLMIGTVVLIAWFHGWRYGVGCALLVVGVNALLLTRLGHLGVTTFHPARLIPLVGLPAIGAVVGHLRDVREQLRQEIVRHRQAEAVARESETWLRAIVDNASEAIVVFDVDRNEFIEVNENAERLFKLDRQELLQSNPMALSPERQPDGRLSEEIIRHNLDRTLAGDKPVMHWIHCDSEGKEFPCEVRLVRLPSSEGRRLIRATVVDVVQRTKAQEELDHIFNLSLEMLCVAGTDGYFKRINPAFMRILRYSEEELLTRPFLEFVHPDDRKATQAEVQKLAQGLPTVRFLNRYRCADGAYRWIEWNSMPDPERGLIYAAARDVTERKRTEEKLQRASNQLAIMLESLPVVSYTCEPDGDFGATYLSSNVRSLTGFAAGQFTSQASFWAERIHPDDAERVLANLRQVVEKGYHHHEYRWQVADGSYKWFFDSLRLLKDTDGKPDRIVGIWLDVTDRKRAEEALRLTRSAVDTAAEAIFRVAPDGSILDANETACRRLEYSRSELLSMSVADIDPHYPVERWPEHWEEIRREGNMVLETEHCTKSGRIFPVEVSVGYFQFEGAEYCCSFARDITERKQAEEALRRSEERFRHLIEGSLQGIAIRQGEQRVFVNEAFARMHGYTVDEILANDAPPELVAPHERERMRRYREARTSGEPAPTHYEYQGLRKDGSLIWVENQVMVIDWDGQPAIQSTKFDITDRKQAEEALRRSEHELRVITDNAPAMISYVDSSYRYRFVNREYEKLFNMPREEIVGRTVSELLGEKHFQVIQPHLDTALTGQRVTYDAPLDLDDEARRWNTITFMPDIRDDGQVDGVFAMISDITERREMEESLRKREHEFHMLADNVPALFAYVGRDQRYRFANRQYEQWYGVSPEACLGRHLREVLGKSVYDQIETRIARVLSGERIHYEGEFEIPRLGRRWASVTYVPEMAEGEVRGFFVLVTDITDRKRAEEESRQHLAELAHVTRLATLGEMVTGLAHELNQPLTAVANSAYACEQALSSGNGAAPEGLKRLVSKISEQSYRAGQIIRRLRRLVQKAQPHRAPTDINELVRDVLSFVETDVQMSGIRVTMKLSAAIPEISIDRIQIEQVVLNLVRNALEAVVESGQQQPEIILETALNGDGVVQVVVSDNGQSIDEKETEQLFEPFFTTKEKGMGMGLAISRSIVETHNGRLTAKSNPDRGMTFCFTLPTCLEGTLAHAN